MTSIRRRLSVRLLATVVAVLFCPILTQASETEEKTVSPVETAATTLGATATKLKQQHDQMGEAMQRAMGKLSGGTLAAINRDYEKLGRTLDALKKKQEALAASMAKGVELKNARQEHWAGMKESAATAES